MNMVLSGLEGDIMYLDDVLVYGNTGEDLIYQIRKVFDQLLDAHLSVNLEKCDCMKDNYHLAWEESGESAGAANLCKDGCI